MEGRRSAENDGPRIRPERLGVHGMPAGDTSLDQQQTLHAGVAGLADDDVIVDGNAERLCCVDDRFGHLDISARGPTTVALRRQCSRIVDDVLLSCVKCNVTGQVSI
jgi:hypothetical protein